MRQATSTTGRNNSVVNACAGYLQGVSAIEQLKTLGHDDHPNAANLIDYSYRKLGDYKLSQVWYERALKADPDHVLTWQYYGLWQIEQGYRDQAQYHRSRIAAICGAGCEAHRSLAAALEKQPGTGLIYQDALQPRSALTRSGFSWIASPPTRSPSIAYPVADRFA